jgi:UDP-N-acetyl-D-glucosamine/UDP-N-acetyl-D-galactosamine dehydrogenase
LSKKHEKGAPVVVTFESLKKGKDKIGVVGLGYVGLPLAVYMSKEFKVVGYDMNGKRINELKAGLDRTREISPEELKTVSMEYTDDPGRLASCRFIIVAVPTPIDEFRNPDFRPLVGASKTVGKHMKKGTCVAFESTVYPGATEEVCVPVLEAESGLKMGKDFTIGYSPERINPGDKEHTFTTITKIVSGSDEKTLRLLEAVYGQVVKKGIHPASSIKVAEAAKVIENTQRDLNIALMNELAMIFEKMGIDTLEVLRAAGTKWNFLPFTPGLVGGHCIGVDPYYLTFKAEAMNYHPEMILAGRRINDNMGKYVAEVTVKMLIQAGKKVLGAKVAVLGLTFKENVPDLRNTRVVDIIRELKDYGVDVLVNDPMADNEEAMKYYGLELVPFEELKGVDAVIIAVIHKAYKEKGLPSIIKCCKGPKPIVIDIKGGFELSDQEKEKYTYWRL